MQGSEASPPTIILPVINKDSGTLFKVAGTAHATNFATLSFASMAAARTITVPDPGADDTIAALAATQTLSNKTISLASGTASAVALSFVSGGGNNGFYIDGSGRWVFAMGNSPRYLMGVNNNTTRFDSAWQVGWASGDPTATAEDLVLLRDAAYWLGLRNGTNAHNLSVYNTFTSSTNYERLDLVWSSNIATIGTDKGSGGGSARVLQFKTGGTVSIAIGTDQKVTITPAASTAPLNLPVLSANPSSPVNGDTWIFDDGVAVRAIRFRAGGVTYSASAV
jgi:hypothetical protein